MKIAILGGTFNPVHNGHIRIARVVRQRLNPDPRSGRLTTKIIFIPCYLPYHKTGYKIQDTGYREYIAPATHRMKMVKLAIGSYHGFEASDIDIKRKGPTYSINTIRKLKCLYPRHTEFYFIIGADTLAELHQWYKIKELAKLVRFVVVPRPGYPRGHCGLSRRGGTDCGAAAESRLFRGGFRFLSKPRTNISSTEIRERIRLGKSIKNLVPDDVARYIDMHKLYQ